MSNVLILAEHDGQQLNQSTAKAVTAAQALNPETINIVLFADEPESLATQAASLPGVKTVYAVKTDDNQWRLAAAIAPAIATLGQNHSHIFGPSTTFGKDVMPRVAALLGVNQVSDIMEVLDSHTFKRPIYAGNVIVTVKTPDNKPVVGTVRTASFKPADYTNEAASIEHQELKNAPTHSRFITLESGDSERPDLQTASTVVSGGRGVGSAENFQMIYDLADKLGAATGASRAAVDAGFVPNDMQVGQTGKIIAPDLYVAIGISGAIQHLTGIKDAGTIVAINKDPEAPIFEVADIGLVGDLFKIVPELTEKL